MPRRSKAPAGPFVKAALICERVLFEKDEVLTFVRMIDLFTVRDRELRDGAFVPPAQLTFFFVLALVRGSFVGQKDLSIRFSAEGTENFLELGHESLDFRGAASGALTMVSRSQVTFHQPGMFWFDIYLSGQLTTRVPLLVEYQPADGQQSAETDEASAVPTET